MCIFIGFYDEDIFCAPVICRVYCLEIALQLFRAFNCEFIVSLFWPKSFLAKFGDLEHLLSVFLISIFEKAIKRQ